MNRGVFIAAGAAALAHPCRARAAEAQDSALGAILQRARTTHSDAFVLQRAGATALQFKRNDTLIDVQSVTKSIASLAIGMLADAGRIALDQLASSILTEWRGTSKAEITIRQLVAGTSGIAAPTEVIALSLDLVKLGLGAPLEAPPGAQAIYNDAPFNLIPEMVRRVSGTPIDAFLGARLFRPLGISEFTWATDPAGHRPAMSGLALRANDLAKIGQLLLARGVWKGSRLISAAWVATATAPLGDHFRDTGLFWWMQYDRVERYVDDAAIARWRKAGVPAAYVDRVATLRGRFMSGAEYQIALESLFKDEGVIAWAQALRKAHTLGAPVRYGKRIGYSAKGLLGQYLIVYPEKRLVAVRLIADTSHKIDDDDFTDIYARLQAIS